MYKCRECGIFFDEPERLYDVSSGERESICPKCGCDNYFDFGDGSKIREDIYEALNSVKLTIMDYLGVPEAQAMEVIDKWRAEQ